MLRRALFFSVTQESGRFSAQHDLGILERTNLDLLLRPGTPVPRGDDDAVGAGGEPRYAEDPFAPPGPLDAAGDVGHGEPCLVEKPHHRPALTRREVRDVDIQPSGAVQRDIDRLPVVGDHQACGEPGGAV